MLSFSSQTPKRMYFCTIADLFCAANFRFLFAGFEIKHCLLADFPY